MAVHVERHSGRRVPERTTMIVRSSRPTVAAEPKRATLKPMDGDFTVDEIVAAIKRIGASKQLATSRNVATELHRLDHTDGDKTLAG